MLWKGPFEVSSVVGLNDYKVKVKGKEKVYHANLLKKYFERKETTVEGAVGGGVGATCIDDAVDCAANIVKLNSCQFLYDHVYGDKSSVSTLFNFSFVSEQHNYATRSSQLQHLSFDLYRINIRKFCPTIIGEYCWNRTDSFRIDYDLPF